MAKLDAFWMGWLERGGRGEAWAKWIAHLPSRDDDVFAPVLNTYRAVGIHNSQVAAVKVSAFESLLSSFVIYEIL